MTWDYIQLGKTTYLMSNGELISESKLRKPCTVYVPDYCENKLNRGISSFSFSDGKIDDKKNEFIAIPDGTWIPFKNFKMLPSLKVNNYQGNWTGGNRYGDRYTLVLNINGMQVMAFQSIATSLENSLKITSGVTDYTYNVLVGYESNIPRRGYPFHSISGYYAKKEQGSNYLIKGINDSLYPIFYRGYAYPKREHVFIWGTLAVLFNEDMTLKAIADLEAVSMDAIKLGHVLFSRDGWFSKVSFATGGN